MCLVSYSFIYAWDLKSIGPDVINSLSLALMLHFTVEMGYYLFGDMMIRCNDNWVFQCS